MAKVPFKDSKLGVWLKTNVPTAINAVENFVPAPVKGGLDIVKNLIGTAPGLTDEQKNEGLKLADDHELEMLKENDANTADARAREIAVKDKTPMVLAYTITGGFFGLLAIMIFHILPNANQTLLNVMVGSLGTAWIGIVNYYFGSSQGSAKKSETIEKMMNS